MCFLHKSIEVTLCYPENSLNRDRVSDRLPFNITDVDFTDILHVKVILDVHGTTIQGNRGATLCYSCHKQCEYFINNSYWLQWNYYLTFCRSSHCCFHAQCLSCNNCLHQNMVSCAPCKHLVYHRGYLGSSLHTRDMR